MGNPLGQSVPHQERIAGLLGFPSERRLGQLLEAVSVAWGPLLERKKL